MIICLRNSTSVHQSLTAQASSLRLPCYWRLRGSLGRQAARLTREGNSMSHVSLNFLCQVLYIYI